ncbi:MAG: hypothetical protein ACOCXP_03040, partial [Candidatus Dojkabacteria bacterium]
MLEMEGEGPPIDVPDRSLVDYVTSLLPEKVEPQVDYEARKLLIAIQVGRGEINFGQAQVKLDSLAEELFLTYQAQFRLKASDRVTKHSQERMRRIDLVQEIIGYTNRTKGRDLPNDFLNSVEKSNIGYWREALGEEVVSQMLDFYKRFLDLTNICNPPPQQRAAERRPTPSELEGMIQAKAGPRGIDLESKDPWHQREKGRLRLALEAQSLVGLTDTSQDDALREVVEGLVRELQREYLGFALTTTLNYS